MARGLLGACLVVHHRGSYPFRLKASAVRCPVSLLTRNDPGSGAGARGAPDDLTLLPEAEV
ncbi:hypothetical protein GCM10023084_64610 [Streptomyces lacrimifluminis]|uniref:Uncharacterized protein n=1 Tax=Streptomyces lacrimifluminis TaxID=1500077 RepID=A0A917LCN9_9ACTN|nr:hypothetical protein GCM10012282_64740 [Streptomyces lacrimifluminis]